MLKPGDSQPSFTATDYLTERSQWPWLALAAYLSSCSLFTFPLAEGVDHSPLVVVVFFPLGSIFSQFAILSAWLVWSHRPLGQRLVLCLCAAGWFFLLWWLSITLAGISGNGRFPLVVLLLIPAITVAVATPLALARSLFGWRIVSRESVPVENPLGIQHLLAFTTLVAVSLALVRLAMRIAAEESEGFWIGLAVATGIAALANTLLVVPLVWLTLRIRNATLGAALAGILGLAAAIAFLTVALMSAGRPPAGIAVGIFCLSLSFVFTTATAFWIARAAGYRLVIGRGEALPRTVTEMDPVGNIGPG